MTERIAEGIIRGLEQAVAYAQGTADRSRYKVHVFVREKLEPRRAKKQRPPIHPGEFLREDFLNPLGMTAEMLAKEIKVPERQVVAIVKERRGLNADLCLRLSRFLGMSPEFWMNIEKDYELETAKADWPKICREIGRHPRDRRTGELKPRRLARKAV
ncbi:MAG TPA: HigA family addiction module antitoxin [Terracidiphilus sp.]|jgi:addiction module HigA family antidote|nr:HigA family addiction module antitoxin [Terracidiphilus sp.]